MDGLHRFQKTKTHCGNAVVHATMIFLLLVKRKSESEYFAFAKGLQVYLRMGHLVINI